MVKRKGGKKEKAKLEVGEKGRREQEARADGTAMRRRSIAPADVAETFHGFSRGEATSEHRRKRRWRRRRTTELRDYSLRCE